MNFLTGLWDGFKGEFTTRNIGKLIATGFIIDQGSRISNGTHNVGGIVYDKAKDIFGGAFSDVKERFSSKKEESA